MLIDFIRGHITPYFGWVWIGVLVGLDDNRYYSLGHEYYLTISTQPFLNAARHIELLSIATEQTKRLEGSLANLAALILYFSSPLILVTNFF